MLLLHVSVQSGIRQIGLFAVLTFEITTLVVVFGASFTYLATIFILSLIGPISRAFITISIVLKILFGQICLTNLFGWC